MSIVIHEVDTRKKSDVNRFLSLPFALYRDHPLWVPLLAGEAKMHLDRDNFGFYRRNDARFYLAIKDGRDAGRICAIHPAYTNEVKGWNDGWFYLFDSIDDQDVADALFGKAKEWLKSRDAQLIRGPLGFMTYDGFGMLAKGFDHPPAVGIPYNFAYYTRLTEAWGFELDKVYYSGYLDGDKVRAEFPEKIVRLAERIKKRYGFEVRTYSNVRELKREVVKPIVEVYNRSFLSISNYPPMTEEIVGTIVNNIISIADPKMLKFIFKDGSLVGFLFCFPDVTRGIRKAKGKLFPLGFLHILADKRKTQWINLNGLGILPEYQGKGGTALLYAELFNTLKDNHQYLHADVVQVADFNTKSLNEQRQFGVDFYKEHNVYKKKI